MSTSRPERTDAASDRDVRAVACRTRPERTVIIEEGNVDGWLSSDRFVDLSRYR